MESGIGGHPPMFKPLVLDPKRRGVGKTERDRDREKEKAVTGGNDLPQ